MAPEEEFGPLAPGGGTGRLLVVTDFEARVSAAVRCAAQLATLHGSTELRLLHLVQPGHPPPEDDAIDDLRKSVHRAERALGRSASANTTVVVRDAETLTAGAVEELESMPADLLVCGTSGRHGRLVDGLVQHPPVDVLFVRHDAVTRWPAEPTRTLVAVDFGSASLRALERARHLGRGPVVLLHVVDLATEPGAAAPVDSPFARDPTLPDRLRARLEDWAGDAADEVIVAQGDIVTEIAAACAREAIGLVVLGAEGARDRNGLVGGRAPDRMITEVPVPVLLVP